MIWKKRATGIHNGIDTKRWIEQVEIHMRLMKDALRQGDVERAEAQAACVRAQISNLMRSIGRGGFSGDVKVVDFDGGETQTIRWISEHESWERSRQLVDKRRAEVASSQEDAQ